MQAKHLIFVGSLVGSCLLTAQAQIFSLNEPAIANAYQVPGTYGFEFQVASAKIVTELGAFDFGVYSGGFAHIELWSRSATSPLAQTSIDLENPRSTGWQFRYNAIAQTELLPGVAYALIWRGNLGSGIQPLTVPNSIVLSSEEIQILGVVNYSAVDLGASPFILPSAIQSYDPGAPSLRGSATMILAPVSVPESKVTGFFVSISLVLLAIAHRLVKSAKWALHR